MLSGMRGVSPQSEDISDQTIERNYGEKALISRTPVLSQMFKTSENNQNKMSGNSRDGELDREHRGEVKGRRTFAFWTLMCLLFFLGIGNLVLTLTILGVLKMGRGMESMEFVPEDNTIKLFGQSDLDHIYKKDGLLESFLDKPLNIVSQNGSIVLNLQSRVGRPETKLVINASGITFSGLSSFNIRDPETGKSVFTTTFPNFGIPDGLKNIGTKIATTKRVTSPIDQNLHLRSDTFTNIRGAEGTHMDSKELLWSADQDIFLKSVNGSVVLSGKDGVFIDVKSVPIALSHVGEGTQATGQFKVCVCMPQGKLFRIAVPTGQSSKVSCSHVNMSAKYNPCI